ncbi:hypothetical protein OSB04_030943 [Centaurea solstitialis]|uniref:Uncharacterized protein n=1 Tax=Centaurea solstitialis TaxID=347529 RepID=A0AA38SL87_9ASTR|nr:hypothetical protein OSB04_030943 [Centaurea solstitialis]
MIEDEETHPRLLCVAPSLKVSLIVRLPFLMIEDADVIQISNGKQVLGIEIDPAEEAIYLTITTDLDQHQETRHYSHKFSASIYRVLKTLRDVSPDSYTPSVVSIGPFHKEAENLKKESYKLSCACDLFGYQIESGGEQRLKACIRVVLAKLPRIKAC